MNFFEHQHKARKKTGLLVLYFLIAVVLTVAALNVAIFIAFKIAEPELAPSVDQWIQNKHWVWVTVLVVVVIGFGTLRTFFRLSTGGRAVAEIVGARRIKMSTNDPDERRFINVVEEMSIASGTPVPALYAMDDEHAINAFVAGYRVNQAVMVVTKGTLEKLDRDELQGVVGHEFSHVLNGDMRLNVRLMATLAGILAIGQIGGFMLRSMRFSGRSRRSNSKGGNVAVVLLIALVLFVVGYIGLFFGRLIKAAVSRQREYLADASAVQFTRNSDGIAGALWKISRGSSRLSSSHAEDMSHMCFSSALSLSSMLATHPPVAKRIAAIDPHYNAKKTAQRAAEKAGVREPAAPSASEPSTTPTAAMGFVTGGGDDVVIRTTTETVIESVGNPTEQHYDYAENLHASLPQKVMDSAHADEDCRSVVYALVMMGTDEEALAVAVSMIKAHDSEQSAQRVQQLIPVLKGLGTAARLPVLDICLPALKLLDEQTRRRFLGILKSLAQSDKRFTLFEFVLVTILNENLAEDADKADVVKFSTSDQVINEIRILLTVLAMAGRTRESDGKPAFERVMKYFSKVKFEMAEKRDLKPERLTEVFETLAQLSPLVKQSLITACADLVLHDGKVLPSEAELLRATALSLDCPMPPLLPAV